MAPPRKCSHQERYRSGGCKQCVRARSAARYRENKEAALAYERSPEVKARKNARRRERYAEDPNRRRVVSRENRKTRYGIDIDAELARCEHQCEICRKPIDSAPVPRGTKRDDVHAAHVDHDHSTGTFRGLLCLTCNLMVGYAKDDPEILIAALDYLRRFLPELKVA